MSGSEGALDIDTVVVAVDEQLSTDVGDEQVILQRDAGVYYGANEVGGYIWELIEEPKTVAEIRDAVLETYDVGPDRVVSDIQAFLEDLHEADLIKVKDGTHR